MPDQVPPGSVDITVIKPGFNPVNLTVTAVLGAPQIVPVILERQSTIEEHVKATLRER